MDRENVDLQWFIVTTVEGVREFIPSYTKDGDGPYLVVAVGNKGSMVWSYEVMSDIYNAYKSVLDTLGTPTAMAA